VAGARTYARAGYLVAAAFLLNGVLMRRLVTGSWLAGQSRE
jgi:hypothetical protein